MRLRALPIVFVLVLAGIAPASASAASREPTPELNAAVTLLPRPCAYEGGDRYEARFYKLEGWKGPDYERYPGACQRLRFSYGPILVKPGQNDVLLEPVKIEKPLQNGFITRFKPNLVRADGTVPPTEQVHLHHGTWLSVPEYGDGPFFAAGEEKTIATFPKGYGMPVKASDQWLLLYMVHSAVQRPMEAYITYDVDFVPQRQAEALDMKPAYPVWLDVRPQAYPVFNTQRRFGGPDERCTWPKEQCAEFDPWGKPTVGQGQPGNKLGTDLVLPARGESLGRAGPFTGGTLIGIGGHVHPGGIQNEIDLVRGGKSERIYTGRAAYWNPKRPSRPTGDPNSWDFSMRVTGRPQWSVRVKPGDALRSNATYDTEIQSTYENMGIAVALLAPDTDEGKPTANGLNPFKARHDRSAGCKSGGLRAKRPTLCDKGIVTHGHLPENNNVGGPSGKWSARPGPTTGEVGIVDFVYMPGDLSMMSMTGLPQVKLGERLRFTNVDGASTSIYHTVTPCKFPCLGTTGVAFPLADGETSIGRKVDFDSSELGFGAPAIGPAKQRLDWELPVTREEGFKPGETVTYFCRIHPSMRGAFEVAK